MSWNNILELLVFSWKLFCKWAQKKNCVHSPPSNREQGFFKWMVNNKNLRKARTRKIEIMCSIKSHKSTSLTLSLSVCMMYIKVEWIYEKLRSYSKSRYCIWKIVEIVFYMSKVFFSFIFLSFLRKKKDEKYSFVLLNKQPWWWFTSFPEIKKNMRTLYC